MKKLHHWNAWIGTDESGKGDYFGPLVVAGVYINNDCIDTFVEMGISDGKKITNSRVEKLANWMWEHYEENIVVIKKMPETYNTDYDHFQSQGKNLNTLLASMHVDVIRRLSILKDVKHALVDKFSSSDIITPFLPGIDVKQETKGERDIAVAAASIIARATFLTDMDVLSKEFNFELPRGATQNVKDAVRDFIRQHGVSALGNVAKLHFLMVDYVQRPYQIQQFCEERGIKTLIHFTRIENLFTILQQGLIGRSHLEASKQPFLRNDHYRADRHPDANCLSISFPNYQMFYSIRKSEKANDSQWVVLLLDAKLLWELDCAFCQRNAASNTVRTIPLDKKKKPEGLKGMFSDFYSIKRQDLNIPKNYPTHPQAEVLVFDKISPDYINVIHFSDATALKDWRSNYIGPFSDKLFTNRMYFTYRFDYEVWKRENFDDDGIPLPDANIDDDFELSDIDNDIPF